MPLLNYTLQKPQGWIDKLSVKKRRVMFNILMNLFPENSFQKILDVGVTADIEAMSSNYLEKYITDKQKIIALSNQEAFFLEEEYPGLCFKKGDARELPFASNSIDLVFSSAVIEHIGSLEDQRKMISECYRVAKKGVFITTPNRWHPVEVHTLLPFIHYLPKKLHRVVLKKLHYDFYAKEENLNLMDKKTFTKICHDLAIKNFLIKKVKTFGFASNLILVIYK